MARMFLHKTIPVLLALYIAVLPAMRQKSLAEDSKSLEQLDFANGLFQRGLYQMAIAEYKKFITLFPQSEDLGDAYFGIAESLFFLKMYEDAASEYEKYKKKFPGGKRAATATLRQGQCFFFLSKPEEALVYLEAVDKKGLNTKSEQILYFYEGKALREKGDNNAALEHFGKSAASGEDTEYAVYSFLEIGDIYSAMSEYGKAVQYYEKAYDKASEKKLKGFALYKTAEAHFSSGDYTSSERLFKRVLDEYPGEEISTEALANMLLSLFNMSAYDKLAAAYEGHGGLIGNDKKFFDAHYTAASAYSELGRHDEALLVLNRVFLPEGLDEHKRRKAFLKKAEILIKAKRFKEVLKAAEEGLDVQDEKHADYVIFLKAEAYYGLGDFKKALELYSRLLNDFPSSPFSGDALYGMAYTRKSMAEDKEASRLFVKYFEEGKDNSKRMEALYNAILIDKKLGLEEKAIEHSLLFIKTFEQGALREKVFFGLGSLYSGVKQYDKAAGIFKEFISHYGESPKLDEAYFLLAYNLQLSKSFDEALLYYGKITPGKGENKLFYSALKNKALIYLQGEKESEAAGVFDRIITELKNNDLGIDTYLWLSKYYIGEKRFNDALRILREAEGLKESADRSKEIAYFKGEAYREIRDFAKAVDNYNIVLSDTAEEDVLSGASRIGKGLCLVETAEFEKAKAEFEAAILADPEDNTITMRSRFELANIEQVTGNPEEAYKMYMLVAILYSDNYYCPEALFRAGGIFEALGKTDEARKSYREIIDKYGGSHLADKAKKRMNILNAT